MKSFIDNNNKKVLKDDSVEEKRNCNCRKKDERPMNGECLTETIVYKAEITTNDNNDKPMVYIGLAGNTFKERFNTHKTSFTREKYEKDTEL